MTTDLVLVLAIVLMMRVDGQMVMPLPAHWHMPCIALSKEHEPKGGR